LSRKKTFLLYTIALAAIVGGALKLLTHYFSRWRLQANPLDYALGVCGIVGGLILIYSPRVRSFVSPVVIAVGAVKGVTDFRDPWDLILSTIILTAGLLGLMKIGIKRVDIRCKNEEIEQGPATDSAKRA